MQVTALLGVAVLVGAVLERRRHRGAGRSYPVRARARLPADQFDESHAGRYLALLGLQTSEVVPPSSSPPSPPSSPSPSPSQPPPSSPRRVVLVEDAASARDACLAISRSRVLGVDVEHSQASFHGFVCTLQVSTVSADFVFDSLRSEVRAFLCGEDDGVLLHRAFASPRVLKLLHGGANDVRWLHANFGVVLSGLLDTQVLARALQKSGGSSGGTGLDTVAEAFGVSAPPALTDDDTLLPAAVRIRGKSFYQRADWARRPLPPDFVEYARRDAALLLALAPALASALLARDPTGALYRAAARTSHAVSLQWYDVEGRERHDAEQARGWAAGRLAAASPGAPTPGTPAHARALHCLAGLCAWRHATALECDKRVDDVLGDETLVEACVEAGVNGWPPRGSGDTAAGTLLAGPHAVAAARVLGRLHAESLAPLPLPAREAGSSALSPSPSPSPSPVSPGGSSDTLMSRFPSKSGRGHNSRAERDAAKTLRAHHIFTPRVAPLYANIRLLAPDGTVMARIDKKKAQWYLDTKTALVDANGALHVDEAGQIRAISPESGAPPLDLRLVRAPKGMGHAGDAFHLNARRNECTVCGIQWSPGTSSAGAGDGPDASEIGGLIRCYVVPRGFRQHLPLAAKSYTNHDVLLTCMPCHRLADVAMGALTRRLGAEMGISMSVRPSILESSGGDASSSSSSSAAAAASASASAEAAAAASADGQALLASLAGLKRTAAGLARNLSKLPAARVAEMVGVFVENRVLVGDVRKVVAADPARFIEGGADASERDNRGALPSAVQDRFRAAWPSAAAAAGSGLSADDVLLVACARYILLLPALLRRAARRQELGRAKAGGKDDDNDDGEVDVLDDADADAVAARDPVVEIMRSVMLGDERWLRAEKHFPPFLRPADEADRAPCCPLDSRAESRLERFVRRWRAHFLTSLAPRAMPSEWSVDFRVFSAGTRCWDKEECELVREVAATVAGEEGGTR